MYIIPIELYTYKTKSKIEGLIGCSSLTKNKIMKHIEICMQSILSKEYPSWISLLIQKRYVSIPDRKVPSSNMYINQYTHNCDNHLKKKQKREVYYRNEKKSDRMVNLLNNKGVQLNKSHAFIIYLFPYRNHFTSSKSTVSLYEQHAYTCCNYIANPKISIHKQPQLLTTKVRFLFINNEM